MNPGSRALPCAKLAAPASRNSLTSRSCRVLCARSTRPLAGLELAQMMSMLSACKARPNWVIPSPPSAPGRLAFDKLQVHQPARRIVDKHQQRALRPAVFEPPMFAAVDLHQLANALAPMARLVNTPAPLFAVEPQPLGDHPFAQGLAGERKAVLSGELLGGQRRTEIGVVLTHDPQNRRADRLGSLAIARPAAFLRDQPLRTLGPKRLQQPPHLALAALQQLRRCTNRQTTAIDVPQHLETPQLPIAHAQHRHRRRPPQPAKRPRRLTSLLSRAPCRSIPLSHDPVAGV